MKQSEYTNLELVTYNSTTRLGLPVMNTITALKGNVQGIPLQAGSRVASQKSSEVRSQDLSHQNLKPIHRSVTISLKELNVILVSSKLVKLVN